MASLKKCKYCKKKFKPQGKQKITCGRKQCTQKRKKDYHREYMQRPEPREKRLEYYSEYSQRPEVKKHIKKYHQIYYQKKKAG
jgi:hypothetical protein